jgi:hypothetical protein
LGVSTSFKTIGLGMNCCSSLSTPFWEFLECANPHLAKIYRKKTFYSLLGVSDYVSLVKTIADQALQIFLLPFGSFKQGIIDSGWRNMIYRTFYSLLGVSSVIVL